MSDLDKKEKMGCHLFIDTEDDDPNVLTDYIGIMPSEVIIKGSKNVKGRVHNCNLWTYKIDLENVNSNFHLNDVLKQLLDLLDTNKDSFLATFRKYSKNHILCYSYFLDYNPYFVFDKHLVKQINYYGIDVEFDLYFLDLD